MKQFQKFWESEHIRKFVQYPVPWKVIFCSAAHAILENQLTVTCLALRLRMTCSVNHATFHEASSIIAFSTVQSGSFPRVLSLHGSCGVGVSWAREKLCPTIVGTFEYLKAKYAQTRVHCGAFGPFEGLLRPFQKVHQFRQTDVV